MTSEAANLRTPLGAFSWAALVGCPAVFVAFLAGQVGLLGGHDAFIFVKLALPLVALGAVVAVVGSGRVRQRGVLAASIGALPLMIVVY